MDYLKDGLLRRGKDDPLLRKGLEKVNDIIGERRRAQVQSRWPLASDPDGHDVFSTLIADSWWALLHVSLPEQEFRPQRYDGVDASGWRIGRGTHVGVFDVDPEARAGSDGRENNDLWLEALHEPVFGGLAYSVVPHAQLADLEWHHRRTEFPEDDPTDRKFHTGRLRATGEWFALVHLDPLVVRIRVDTHDADRRKTEQVLATALQRLDVDALTAWRAAVREARPPADSPTPAPTPDEPPAPTGGGRNDPPGAPAPAPADAPVVEAPSPEHLKHGLDARITPAVPELAPDDLERALGAPVERTRTIGVTGLVEGVRHQVQGGKALDLLRVVDPSFAAALRAGTVPGTEPGPWAEVGAARWTDLGRDTDGAYRFAGDLTDGTMLYVRVRGVKLEDVYPAARLVMDHTT